MLQREVLGEAGALQTETPVGVSTQRPGQHRQVGPGGAALPQVEARCGCSSPKARASCGASTPHAEVRCGDGAPRLVARCGAGVLQVGASYGASTPHAEVRGGAGALQREALGKDGAPHAEIHDIAGAQRQGQRRQAGLGGTSSPRQEVCDGFGALQREARVGASARHTVSRRGASTRQTDAHGIAGAPHIVALGGTKELVQEEEESKPLPVQPCPPTPYLGRSRRHEPRKGGILGSLAAVGAQVVQWGTRGQNGTGPPQPKKASKATAIERQAQRGRRFAAGELHAQLSGES